VLRVRRLDPGAASLAAIALTAGAYWLTHASLDWFWPYPVVTAPVLALLGSACAPALRESPRRTPGPGRRWLVIAVVAFTLTTIPTFLSERYLNSAYAEWRTDLGRAYDDLDRARSLNPLSVDPLLAEGSIARATGDDARAIAAFQRAVDKRPEEWVSYYLLAKLHAKDDPSLARQEAATARERDPLNRQIRSLQRKLRG
jgi:hypothetical protein